LQSSNDSELQPKRALNLSGVALFHLADISFCYGLLEAIARPSAPSISWVEALSPVVPKNVWGIYVLLLKNRAMSLYCTLALALAHSTRAFAVN
jgi:hypothetical protein